LRTGLSTHDRVNEYYGDVSPASEQNPVIQGVEARCRHRTGVVDLASVAAQVVVRMTAKAASDVAFHVYTPLIFLDTVQIRTLVCF
jgi:hypothetical protein